MGGRDTAITYHGCTWGVLTVRGPHCTYHRPRWHVLPWSTLLRLQGALQGHCPKRTLHLVRFPGPSCSGSQVVGEGPIWQLACSPLVFAQSFVLWACQGSPCCVRAFHGKGLLFFFLVFLEIPWFGLLSHVSSLRLSSGHSGLVMQPTPPCPALTCWCRMRVSGLLHRQLRLGAYSLGFFNFNFNFSSWLCCPLRFQNSPQSTCERISYFVGNFSFMTPTPGWISVPKTFVSVFVFYILSYLLLKRLGCLPGCLVSSASVQNLFCGSC